MIRIVIGGVGSGKTALAVRDMMLSNHDIYSNIITKRVKRNHVINKDMIVKSEIVKYKKDGEPIKNHKLNKEFWQEIHQKGEKISVYLDEAHTLINPRRSMSKMNIIMTDFMALLRRVVGSSEFSYGELVLITQLERRLDVIAKEMAVKIQYCKCHYIKRCHKCGFKVQENNETPEKIERCPKCESYKIKKSLPIIEVFCFNSIDKYTRFKDFKQDTFYSHYVVKNIHKVFDNYDTLQWDNLITEE